MSAKGRGTKPVANDAYPTPPWAVHRLLEATMDLYLGERQHEHWLEPAAGNGVIVSATDIWFNRMVEPCPIWEGLDVVGAQLANFTRPGGIAKHLWVDFLTWNSPRHFDVAITNPPFSLAFEFAKKMVEIARHSFLLTRLNILEAGKKSGRLKWLSANTPDVYVLPDRPCFSHSIWCEACDNPAYPIAWDAPTPWCCGYLMRRSAGTDATGYCWLHWDSSKLPRTSGLITHLAETPSSERVDRVVER